MGEQLYHTQLFAQAMNTPAMIAAHQLTPPPVDHHSTSTTTTIKMEDLAAPMPFSSPSQPPTSHPHSHSPSPSEAKSVKKRKSWGQVLPEPKTNLPPRKRAKTEDEKEQRRIERVKRNRLAAHNSRERKRQEVEILQAEKDKLEVDLQAAQAIMARMAAQLKAFQSRHPNEVDDHSFDTSSSVDDYESFVGQQDTICPRQTSFPSPVSMDSMDSPRDDSCQPETPAYSESVATDLDQTRYPAAILCDLQCRSRSVPPSQRSSLQAILAFLTLFNLTLPLMRSPLTTSSTSSPSPTTTMWSTILAWAMLQTSSHQPSSTPTPQIPTAFLSHLTADLSTCRMPLAQLMLATCLSQRKSSSQWIARSTGKAGWTGKDGAVCRRSSLSRRLRRTTGRKRVSSFEQDTRLPGSSASGMSKHHVELWRRAVS